MLTIEKIIHAQRVLEEAIFKTDVVRTSNFIDGYERRQSPRAGIYFWLLDGSNTEPPAEGTDLHYLRLGHITLTLMGDPLCLETSVWDGLGIG